MIEKLSHVIDTKRIRQNVSMASMTTFRTGGNADILITPQTTEELKNVLKLLYELKQPYYVLGNGSNLLISDNGVHRPVICIGKEFSSVDIFDNCISAKSGATLPLIAKLAADNSLSGLEFASGIPGTLGGAIIMNAGAYGGEMKDVVEAVSFLSADGNEYVLSGEEMEFCYRKSALSDTDCIITGATLKLFEGEQTEIQSKMSDFNSRRREKQPLEFPSAGSTFKRPEGYFAGALIETSGLKGRTVGGAQVSEKHAGFIINKGNATSTDILELIKIVIDTVYEKHGVVLETEAKYWE